MKIFLSISAIIITVVFISVIFTHSCATKVGWKLASSRDTMSDKIFYDISLSASDGDADLDLDVQCLDGKSRIVIFRDKEITAQGGAIVEFRFNMEEPISGTWETLDGKNGLEYDGNVDEFITKLISSHSLRLRINSSEHGLLESQFDTSGLLDAMRPASKACNWSDYFVIPQRSSVGPTLPPAVAPDSQSRTTAPANIGHGFLATPSSQLTGAPSAENSPAPTPEPQSSDTSP